MAKIKVTTFNIRVAVDCDGPKNLFSLRKSRIFKFIEEEKPDIIGFQEVSDSQRNSLREEMKGYTLVGCGREKNLHGESVTLAYRTDKFELIELKNFWLSMTPDKPGSRYMPDQSNCPRVTTAALLKYNEGGEPFWFINTHLDHEGETARIFASMQLMHFISECEYPVILTGDFNAYPEDKEIRMYSENPACALVDCTANIKGSFHAYRDISEEEMGKIDYIFTNIPGAEANGILHEDIPEDGTFMSDHRPLSSYIEL